MCKWFCTSEGPSTNLQCLHCHVRYCGACLHGEAGKMESLVKCAKCGKKPRTVDNNQRGKWKAESTQSGNNVNTANTTGSSGARASALTDEHSGQTFASGLREEKEKKSSSTATKAKKSNIFDKLTDTSLYTGTHQHRFDASGQGRGLEGRDSVAKGAGHTPAGNVSHRVPVASISSPAASDSSPKYSSSAGSSPRKPAAKPKSHQSIFDKLTDSSLYTGAHKHRFDSSGHGQGKAGRTQQTGGVTLSQITRPGL